MKTLYRSEKPALLALTGLTGLSEVSQEAVEAANPSTTWHCFSSFQDAEKTWRSLEQDATGSVYQRYDWCKCWFDVFSTYRAIKPLIVAASVGTKVSLLLPLYIQSGGAGAKVARFMGDDHANLRVPLLTNRGLERSYILRLAKQRELFTALGQVLRNQREVDFVDLSSMPAQLDGNVNPLAHVSAKSSEILFFSGRLDSDFERLKAARRPTKSQRKTRRNIKQLERHGALSFEQVHDPSALNAILDLFFEQKSGRLTKAGVRSAFELEANQTFLRQLANASLVQDNQTLELYVLKAGDEPVAIAGGGRFNDRFSMGINSMTANRTYAMHGPGRISVDIAVEWFCRQGVASFDLGLGENEYKHVWCDPVPLVDVVFHVTGRGLAYRCLAATKRAAIRTVRKSPLLLQLAQRVRLELQRVLA